MTATITAPATDETPLYRRAETRLALVGKGKRIHYSANDDTLCGKAITRHTDATEAADLGHEHCGRCIRIAEDRAYAIGLAGPSPLIAALHDVVDTVEAVDAQRAAETATEPKPPATDDDAEQIAPQADDEPAKIATPADEPAEVAEITTPAHADAPAETDEGTVTFPAVDAPADAVDPATIRPGDLVEGVIASTHPRTVRVRVDRAPWPINRRCTVLCDGRGIDAVYTHTLRLLGDDAEADAASPADVPAALAAFARVAAAPAPAAPAAEPADDTPAEAAPASPAAEPQAEADTEPAPVDHGDEPEPQDDEPAFPAGLIRLGINPRRGTFHLGAMTDNGPAILCGQYVSPSLAPVGDDTAHSLCPACERALAVYTLADPASEPERRLSEGTKTTAIAHYVIPTQNRTYCGKPLGHDAPGKKARVCTNCNDRRMGVAAFCAVTGDDVA